MLEAHKALEKVLLDLKAQALVHNMPKFDEASDQIRALFQVYALPGETERWRAHGFTSIEHTIAEYLFARLGKVVRKDAIYTAVYGSLDDGPGEKIIDIFICKMRRKLKGKPTPYRIETIWGRGYRMVDTPGAEITIYSDRGVSAGPQGLKTPAAA